METQETTLTRESMDRLLARIDPWLGWLLFAGGLLAIFIFLFVSSLLGQLIGVAAMGLGAAIVAYRFPIALVAGLWAVALFNFGKPMAGAVIKLSEGVIILMLLTILMRAAAGDAALFARLRRAGLPIAMLGVLGFCAILTAIPHPNVFNVRYEIFNIIACVFAMLFFRRRHWPLILFLFVAALAVESLAALAIKFGLGWNGIALFDVRGGISPINFTSEELVNLAGGMFRVSGTMGHKNMLAAFIILLLPTVGIEMFHRFRPSWLLVLVPTLVALALTDSMTGWGAAAVVLVLILLHLRRFDYLAILALVVLPIGILFIVKYGEPIFYRIAQLFGTWEGGATARSRVTIFKISMDLIREYPWMGIGRHNFMAYGMTYYNHAHNLFLMKIIEMGIPAGVGFAAFLIGCVVAIWRPILLRARELSAHGEYYRMLGLWLGLVGFLAMNMFDYNYNHFSLGPMFMTMLGIGLSVALNLEPNQDVR